MRGAAGGDQRGLWIAMLGCDGAGKSSLAAALDERLRGAFRRVRVLHFRPGLGRGEGGPVTDPHGRPPRSLPVSLAKLLFYLADYLLGYGLRVRPALVRSTLVLFDRYYHDVLADPRRYRYGGPMWLARLVGRAIPRPDLFIVLDLPAELAHARKPEVPLEEARRLRERYLALARDLPNARVVDASRPLEAVVAEVEEIILDFLARRVRERLARAGVGP